MRTHTHTLHTHTRDKHSNPRWAHARRGLIKKSGFNIIESVDSISRDERDALLTQYITNAGITE